MSRIWIKNTACDRLCFVKKFNVTAAPLTAPARIAADTKYWLYVNGALVLFEGGLKRGATENSIYEDELDLAPYLHSGENTVAALVCFYSYSGFSHIAATEGGFSFECDLGGGRIISDGTWKAHEHTAYIKASEDNNFRLSEPNVCFDAARDLGEWYAVDYDTSDWQYADVLGEYENKVKRPIPFFKDYGLKQADFTRNGDIAEVTLPYNMQFTPYFEISSKSGRKITIKTDTYDDNLYDTKSVIAEYITADGVQKYESLGWISGEKMYITLPSDVELLCVKYRETGYGCEFAGSFECDDEFLNKLWEKSRRTLYITMRDNFMDCPDRERAQWWGDANIEMQMALYALDKNALRLYQKGAREMAYYGRERIITVVPSGNEQFELPMQNLAGICGFSYYHRYTGDTELIRDVYPTAKKYVMEYGFEPSGLVRHKKGSWDWADWGENFDIPVMENAWYYMALTSCMYMAHLLGENDDAAWYTQSMEQLFRSFNSEFYSIKGYYYGKTDNEKPDDRANALAILSQLASESTYGAIVEKVLCTTMNSSPYMEKYVLDAMCKAGAVDKAIERIKTRYAEMVECDCTTLWEYWSTDGTKNHAWSGGPLITMSKYIAGIAPSETAYSMIRIKPCMGHLRYVRCEAVTAVGRVGVEIEKKNGTVTLCVSIPEGTQAEVYVPHRGGYKRCIIGESCTLCGEE